MPQQQYRVANPISIDVPDEREYDDDDAAALDRALGDTIAAAEQAEKDDLAQQLRFELGSHYYETR
jgi:hypothetical protein